MSLIKCFKKWAEKYSGFEELQQECRTSSVKLR